MASQRTAPLTLRHVLCQQKPTILCKSKLNRNSRSLAWPEVAAFTIWRDFNLENLNDSYGHILDADDLLYPLELPQVEVLQGVETEVDRDIGHLIAWNDALMQQTLLVAKTRLGICQESNLTYLYSTPDKSVIAKLPNASSGSQVDHVIGLDNRLEPVLVVGLGRLSSKWACMKLLAKLPQPSGEMALPLRQLGNLCRKAGTRYGYIQTEEDLVVCCFSDTDNGEDLKAAVMPVPCTKHGVNMLTSELALWWLCMIAMSPNHSRLIQKEQDMVKINEWERLYHDADTTVMRHRYSNFEKSMSPATPSMAFINLAPASSGINQNYLANPVQPEGTNNPKSLAELEDWGCSSNSADESAWNNPGVWTIPTNPNTWVDPKMLSMNQVADSGFNQSTYQP
ncbi:hypothetical protein X797_009959 [Metarhizium robertsii]|uniref:Uncharacterized protein n=2 Tax=Metarhizium robertsii TaxID=568076 RepID=A0A0B2X9D8_METRA|nr:uncharacterized protein MAA_10999 [Metarhizium robertsii ARSEF 23]EXU96876.1 hypothetical protein X797_009959 [Metarhizium robertsii]KHO11483.1 hypothetical protein MAA_10999 [Metarhizium robertsii ARSEF 23]